MSYDVSKTLRGGITMDRIVEMKGQVRKSEYDLNREITLKGENHRKDIALQ